MPVFWDIERGYQNQIPACHTLSNCYEVLVCIDIFIDMKKRHMLRVVPTLKKLVNNSELRSASVSFLFFKDVFQINLQIGENAYS